MTKAREEEEGFEARLADERRNSLSLSLFRSSSALKKKKIFRSSFSTSLFSDQVLVILHFRCKGQREQFGRKAGNFSQ